MKAESRLPSGQQREDVVEVAEELALGVSLLEEARESVSVRMVGGWVGDEDGILELRRSMDGGNMGRCVKASKEAFEVCTIVVIVERFWD
jgi:hypothetical protein